jgi:bacterial/archaeal transporter family-2 protein
MTPILLAFLAILGGIAAALQSAANAALATRAGLGAALAISSTIVLAGTVVLLLATGGFRALSQAMGAPWHHYIGGLCGFTIIASITFVFARLGAALALALVVLGQSAMALAIDHFGLWGMTRAPLNGWRIAGTLLLVGGVVLMRR